MCSRMPLHREDLVSMRARQAPVLAAQVCDPQWKTQLESATLGEISGDELRGCRFAFMLTDAVVVDRTDSADHTRPEVCTYLWGADVDGRSVHVTVRGFAPFVFVCVPDAVMSNCPHTLPADVYVASVLGEEIARVGVPRKLIGKTTSRRPVSSAVSSHP